METKEDMNKHCCDDMCRNINFNCENHSNPFKCSDILIYYNEKWNEYGLIIHDSGTSYITINYCPWCGKKLPDSKADTWFDELEKLGFTNHFSEDIPKKYTSAEWYLKSNQ